MSNLEELIERLCPDGVEYESLIDLCDVLYGFPCDASKFNDDMIGLPLVRIRDVLEGKSDTYTIESVPEEYKIHSGDLLVGMDGNFHVGIWKDIEAILCQRVCRISSKDNEVLLDGFLNHLIEPIMKKIELGKQSGTVKHLLAKDIKAIKLPVPPLEVQREIVRILDNFTFLTTELAAELAARQKQYEYYRDLLLTFKPNESTILNERTNELELSGAIHWMKLGDIADIGTGNGNTNEGLDTGKYPFFVRSQDIKYKNEYDFDETAIITSGDGVGVGKIFHFVSGKYALHQRAYRVHITSDNVLPKYFFYYFKNSFLTYISKASFHSSVTSIRRPMMINFPVPVPPLEVQQRIVDILDRFDTLCNDISSGLPAEIEARQKQYEYYRDKLLTFKELKKEA
ncbi:restriction endonuclease subunit S [Phascolarctobacterium succinatutens]|uniref:restriction endonuclease subunit S n=2 Tax=Phascolarctobacterium succinatutens TaxID=626940 RepID=UPI00307F9153